MMPSAIIFAAGRGSRLRPHTERIPKCMLKINGKTLIELQVDACRLAGIKDITVIIGYKGEAIKRLLGRSVRYVWNKRFASTQTLYSLHCARAVEGPVIHIDGDNYFDAQLIERIIKHPEPNALLVDTKAKVDQEATKVASQGGKIRYIGKDIPLPLTSGECCGIMKLDRRLNRKLLDQAAKFSRQGKLKEHVFGGLNPLLNAERLALMPLGDARWIEIDFLKDYEKAQRMAQEPVVLIFAAGVGRRAFPLTKECPKALLKVGSQTLLERQVALCRKVGLKDIVVICGFKMHKVKRLMGNAVRYAYNPYYRSTQTMYSLWCARKFAHGRPIITIMGDMLFEEKLLRTLVDSPHKDAILVDFNSYIDENSTIAVIKQDRVEKVTHRFKVESAQGEYLGIDKYCAEGARLLFEECAAIVKEDGEWRKAHIPIIPFAAKRHLWPICTKKARWIEVDFDKDYQRAQRAILREAHT